MLYTIENDELCVQVSPFLLGKVRFLLSNGRMAVGLFFLTLQK